MARDTLEDVLAQIEDREGEMVESLAELISIPAIAPESGGNGEWDKSIFIEELFKKSGCSHIEHIDSKDQRVPGGKRPNLVGWWNGTISKRLIVVLHTDVVPPGDLEEWNGDPFKAEVREGKVYGRGTEDNGQSLITSVYALRALKEMEMTPELTVGILAVSDEEVGSGKGIEHLIAQGFFKENDLILIPDHGTPDGRLVEITEKGLGWIKVITRGKQCHASMPDLGKNAFKAAMRYGTLACDTFRQEFSSRDRLFDRPFSTLEPTKKEANIPNINTIPGEDVFYFDCRLLPEYNFDQVMHVLRRAANTAEEEEGVQITLEFEHRDDAAPPTPESSELVVRLLDAIKEIRDNDPYPGGIGGNTFGAVVRKAGYHAVVWETTDNMAHASNEYCKVENIVSDCKVLAALFLGQH